MGGAGCRWLERTVYPGLPSDVKERQREPLEEWERPNWSIYTTANKWECFWSSLPRPVEAPFLGFAFTWLLARFACFSICSAAVVSCLRRLEGNMELSKTRVPRYWFVTCQVFCNRVANYCFDVSLRRIWWIWFSFGGRSKLYLRKFEPTASSSCLLFATAVKRKPWMCHVPCHVSSLNVLQDSRYPARAIVLGSVLLKSFVICSIYICGWILVRSRWCLPFFLI